MSEVKDAFERSITKLTRTVDQLERVTSGDISVLIGGAVLDVDVTNLILKHSSLKSDIIMGLAGAGYGHTTFILSLLPLVAIEAITNNESPDVYVSQFSALADRLRAASENYRGSLSQRLADDEPAPGDTDETFDADRVIDVLASLGLSDIGNIEQTEPGVYTGTATIKNGDLLEGVVGSPFNTEGLRRQPDETWGPCSPWRADERRFPGLGR